MSKQEIDIIPRVNRALIKEELSKGLFVDNTIKGDNEIYSVNGTNAPNTLKEIGRLRELTFRSAGGGTGKALDLDEYDVSERQYEQLIVWSPEDEEIVGGYRYIDCHKAYNPETEAFELSTTHYFEFSEQFKKEYLPYTIELGRSWVQPAYQPAINPRKGIFALANIWDGLNCLILNNPNSKYFFGKVTMYPDYNSEARDLLLFFMQIYFPDKEVLLWPHNPLQTSPKTQEWGAEFEGLDFAAAFKLLQKMVRELGESIPPLLNVYMNTSATMKTFGTAINTDFGSVEETGILITIADIYESTRARHSKK